MQYDVIGTLTVSLIEISFLVKNICMKHVALTRDQSSMIFEISELNEGNGDDFDFVGEEQPDLWHFPLKLHVTEDMFPKVRVLVYFVTSLGEMVADTINFDVDPCIRNEVSDAKRMNPKIACPCFVTRSCVYKLLYLAHIT